MTELTYTERLTVVHCTCGIAFAIPVDLNTQMLDHRPTEERLVSARPPVALHGKTEAEKERERAEAVERGSAPPVTCSPPRSAATRPPRGS